MPVLEQVQRRRRRGIWTKLASVSTWPEKCCEQQEGSRTKWRSYPIGDASNRRTSRQNPAGVSHTKQNGQRVKDGCPWWYCLCPRCDASVRASRFGKQLVVENLERQIVVFVLERAREVVEVVGVATGVRTRCRFV